MQAIKKNLRRKILQTIGNMGLKVEKTPGIMKATEEDLSPGRKWMRVIG